MVLKGYQQSFLEHIEPYWIENPQSPVVPGGVGDRPYRRPLFPPRHHQETGSPALRIG